MAQKNEIKLTPEAVEAGLNAAKQMLSIARARKSRRDIVTYREVVACIEKVKKELFPEEGK